MYMYIGPLCCMPDCGWLAWTKGHWAVEAWLPGNIMVVGFSRSGRHYCQPVVIQMTPFTHTSISYRTVVFLRWTSYTRHQLVPWVKRAWPQSSQSSRVKNCAHMYMYTYKLASSKTNKVELINSSNSSSWILMCFYPSQPNTRIIGKMNIHAHCRWRVPFESCTVVKMQHTIATASNIGHVQKHFFLSCKIFLLEGVVLSVVLHGLKSRWCTRVSEQVDNNNSNREGGASLTMSNQV